MNKANAVLEEISLRDELSKIENELEMFMNNLNDLASIRDSIDQRWILPTSEGVGNKELGKETNLCSISDRIRSIRLMLENNNQSFKNLNGNINTSL